MEKIIKSFILSILFSIIANILVFLIFKPVLISDTVIISFAVHPFNICETSPVYWYYTKLYFIIISFITYCILFYNLFSRIIPNTKKKSIISNDSNSLLSINIGYDLNNNIVSIPDKSLYQNILITGTIGSGKTSCAMYPFTEQLIEYKSNNTNEKLRYAYLGCKR